MKSTLHANLRVAGRQSRGFSLLEMAVVLVVLGVMLGGALSTLSSHDERKRMALTEERMNEAREALLGFALVNGRLPRPASAATDGVERPACATEAECTGFIAWTALGLQRLDGEDKLLRYSVTPAFANAPFSMATLPTKAVQTRNGAGALAYIAGAAACPANSGCVPAVLHSSGKFNFGTMQDGTARPNDSVGSTNSDEITNNAASVTFVARDFAGLPAAAGGEFDDRLLWLPAPVLFGRMVQAGKLP